MKWVKVEALEKIIAANILKFFKRNILAWYEIPQSIVTDNGTEFTYKSLKKLLEGLKVKQNFTQVEYPETNKKA